MLFGTLRPLTFVFCVPNITQISTKYRARLHHLLGWILKAKSFSQAMTDALFIIPKASSTDAENFLIGLLYFVLNILLFDAQFIMDTMNTFDATN